MSLRDTSELGASVLGTGGSVWQPRALSRPPGPQHGGGRSRWCSVPVGSSAQPPVWAPVGGSGHLHPSEGGAQHLHTGVPAGLCPVEAACPAAPGSVLGEALGRGPHFPARAPCGSFWSALWTQAACGWSQQVVVGIAVPASVTTPSVWLHLHLLSILASPVAVPGADRPCGCSGGCSGSVPVSRAPARGHGEEGAPTPMHLMRRGY